MRVYYSRSASGPPEAFWGQDLDSLPREGEVVYFADGVRGRVARVEWHVEGDQSAGADPLFRDPFVYVILSRV